MPCPICPHCGFEQAFDKDTYNGWEGNTACYHCKGKYYIKFGYVEPTPYGVLQDPPVLSGPKPLGDPELLKGLTVPIIPQGLFRIFEKASLSLAVEIPEGTVVLCRYVLQQALLLKGIPDKPPEDMVNIATQRKPPLLSKLAVRQCRAAIFMGGKGGHPQKNWIENITPDDARQALLVTKRILLELFNPDGLGA